MSSDESAQIPQQQPAQNPPPVQKPRSPKDFGSRGLQVGIKPTNKQIEERVEHVVKLILQNKTKHEIFAECKRKWNVHWITGNRYLIRAKEAIKKRGRMDVEEARGIGVSTLLRVMASDNPSAAATAERNLSRIYGYDVPTRITADVAKPEQVTITNPPPSGPTVVFYLPEGRRATFKPPQQSDATESAT